MTNFIIRPASIDEFSIAVEWAANEGWNPGLSELEAFLASDPQGFLMGWLGEEPVSSISVVRYGDNFGFLWFYIVHRDHRGTGKGMATWNAGIAHLEGRTIGLDGVLDQQDNYKKSGFIFEGCGIRYTGVPTLVGTDRGDVSIRNIKQFDVDAVLDFDRNFFPSNRDIFAEKWVSPKRVTDRITKIAISDGTISGYGTIRPCRTGYKVGPLFAEDPLTAQSLFKNLCAEIPKGIEVSLDVPDANKHGLAIAQDYGLKPVFETARMYRGQIPKLPLSKIFGITTFELG